MIQDALQGATKFAKNEEKVKLLAQKYEKTKLSNNSSQNPIPQNSKKNNHMGGFVQHEGGFRRAHNYQVDRLVMDEDEAAEEV